MFKLIVISYYITVSFAKPGYIEPGISITKSSDFHKPGTVLLREHTIENIDEHDVHSHPLESTGQSQIILHKHLSHGLPSAVPSSTVIKSYDTPTTVIKSYDTPTIVKSYETPILVPDVQALLIQSVVPAVKTVVIEHHIPTVLLDQPSLIAKKHVSHLVPTIDNAPTVVKTYNHPTVT